MQYQYKNFHSKCKLQQDRDIKKGACARSLKFTTGDIYGSRLHFNRTFKSKIIGNR